MVAVEFGVIDLEYGQPFYPNNPATREFAASTLVYCLGFQPDELTYTFTEKIVDRDAAQIAINRGWFALSGNRFMPDQAITAAEKSKMLADAEAILAGDVFDENHENTGYYADDVIVFPKGTYITRDDENNILIYDTSISLKAGDTFGVYYADLPMAFVAVSVSIGDGYYIIEATTDGAENAVIDLDFEGVLPADLTEFSPSGSSMYMNADGAYVYESATEFELITDGAGVKTELKASKKINIVSGISATVDAKFKDISIDYKYNQSTQEYRAVLNGDASLNLTVEGSVSDLATGDHSVTLGSCPVGVIGEVSLALEYDLSGVDYFVAGRDGRSFSHIFDRNSDVGGVGNESH